MCGFPGKSMPDTLFTDLNQRGLGGVLIFGYNIDNPGQLTGLTITNEKRCPDPPVYRHRSGGRKGCTLKPKLTVTRKPLPHNVSALF